MHTISQLLERINLELDSINLITEPAELYEPIEYTIALSGKRIRPVLSLLGCELFGGDIEKVIAPAIGIELFHNFTLLHDDIMDQSPIRRGKPTVFKKWDINTAILSGDTMFVKAYEFVIKTEREKLPEILAVFNQTAKEVCEGQQYDMNFEKKLHVSIEDYLLMIRLKTAVLLGASLKIGAIIANASDEDCENLYKFGENLGIAFQLMDDLLDAFADETKFGKKIGNDILTNKKTFLYLTALEDANPQLIAELLNAFNEPDSKVKIKRVKAIYEELGVKEKTLRTMDSFFTIALEHFEKIKIPKGNKKKLLDFAYQLMKRDR